MSTTKKTQRSRDKYGRFLGDEIVEKNRLMKYYKGRLNKPMVQVKPVQWDKESFVKGIRHTLDEMYIAAEEKRLIDYQTYLYNHAYE